MSCKSIFLLTLTFLGHSLQAGNNNFDKLYREFSDKMDVKLMAVQKPDFEKSDSMEITSTDVGQFVVAATAMAFSGLVKKDLKIDELEVLILDRCTESIRTSFNKKARKCSEDDYETLVFVENQGEQIRILTRKDGENITELIALFTGKSPTFVRLKGLIKESVLQKSLSIN